MAKVKGPTITVDRGSSVWDYPAFGRITARAIEELQDNVPENISVRFRGFCHPTDSAERFASAEFAYGNTATATVVHAGTTTLITSTFFQNVSKHIPLEELKAHLAQCLALQLRRRWAEGHDSLQEINSAIESLEGIVRVAGF